MIRTLGLLLLLALCASPLRGAADEEAPAGAVPPGKPRPVTTPPGPETRPREPVPGGVPSPETPLPEVERARFTFVPLPIFYADPNIGLGYGFMPVLLYHPGRRIEVIAAPSVDYNDIEKLDFTSRIFWYPTREEELYVENEQSLAGQIDHEVRFHGRDRFIDYTDFVVRTYYYNDGTRRFFGLGSGTEARDETNYSQREFGVEGDLGYRFWDRLRVAGTFRYRRTSQRKGIIADVRDTTKVFPGVPGVNDKELDTFAIGGRLTLDLRDNAAIPNEGFFADGVVETAPAGLISDFGFWRWIADARLYIPVYEDRWIHVMRGVLHGISADERTPFWELPTLGGASNLRGFGVGRFTDDNYLLFSVEERIRVYDMNVRRNRLAIEFAGFVDFGRVYGRGGGLDTDNWQLVPGAGGRLLLPDSAIVARGDIGLGPDGPAIFIVLGYPF
jgi:hypothetical protein